MISRPYPENFRILKKIGVEVQRSKGAVEFFGSDQIRSVLVSTGRDELRS